MRIANIKAYDDNVQQTITVDRKDGAYTIKVNNRFYSTHENREQVNEEIDDIMRMYRWSFIPEI